VNKETEKKVLIVGNADDFRRVLRALHQEFLVKKPCSVHLLIVKTDPPVVDYGFPKDAKNRRM